MNVALATQRFGADCKVLPHPQGLGAALRAGTRLLRCMVRRGTATEKFGREDKSAQMYSAFGWRVVLLARMSCARVCPFKTRRSLKTIRNSRLRTRRCDCSFVVTYPVQTSVEKLQAVVVVWESGSAQRFQAEGAFVRGACSTV